MRFSFDSKRKMVKIFDTIANKEIAAIPTVAIDCYIDGYSNGKKAVSKTVRSTALTRDMRVRISPHQP